MVIGFGQFCGEPDGDRGFSRAAGRYVADADGRAPEGMGREITLVVQGIADAHHGCIQRLDARGDGFQGRGERWSV